MAARIRTSGGSLTLLPAATSPASGSASPGRPPTNARRFSPAAGEGSGSKKAGSSSSAAESAPASVADARALPSAWPFGAVGASAPPAAIQSAAPAPAISAQQGPTAFQPFHGHPQIANMGVQGIGMALPTLNGSSSASTQTQAVPAMPGAATGALAAGMLPLQAADAAEQAMRTALLAQEQFRRDAINDLQARLCAGSFARFLLDRKSVV